MRLMRTIEVPESPRDRVFRASKLHAVIFVLVCLGACASLIAFRWPRPKLAYYICAVILLVLLLGHRFIVERFHPANWLVRTSDDGIYIHFRSYLNERPPSQDGTVVFLAYAEIRSARLIREKISTPGEHGTPQTQFVRWVELELADDPAPLAAAIAAECARPGVPEKRWYGSSTTLYKDYPVLMQTPPFLRLRWQVVPRAPVFLDALRRFVEVGPSIATSESFTSLQALPREEQTQRLRELDQRGETIAAVYTARRLYGYDLTQATNFVKSLRGGSPS